MAQKSGCSYLLVLLVLTIFLAIMAGLVDFVYAAMWGVLIYGLFFLYICCKFI